MNAPRMVMTAQTAFHKRRPAFANNKSTFLQNSCGIPINCVSQATASVCEQQTHLLAELVLNTYERSAHGLDSTNCISRATTSVRKQQTHLFAELVRDAHERSAHGLEVPHLAQPLLEADCTARHGAPARKPDACVDEVDECLQCTNEDM